MTPEYRELRINCSLKYLEEVFELAVKHRATEAYIRSLYEDAEGIGGIDYTRVLTNRPSDPGKLPDSVAHLVEMKERAETEAAEYFDRKDEARRLLDEMGGVRSRLLLLRFASAMPWVCVAEALNYREDYCRAMRNDALCDFYDYLPREYKVGSTHAILDADF